MNNTKAFPNTAEYPLRNDGMDLRDYFASKAIEPLFVFYGKAGMSDYGQLAFHAYKIADAMMKAREN